MATYTWNSGSGLWTDPTRWTPTGTPTIGDTAVITTGTLDLETLTLASEVINLSPSSTAQLTLHNVTLTPTTSVNISGGGFADAFGEGSVVSVGAVNIGAAGSSLPQAFTIFDNNPFAGSVLTNRGQWNVYNGSNFVFSGHGDLAFVNAATIQVTSNVASGSTFAVQTGHFTNNGNVIVAGGTAVGAASSTTSISTAMDGTGGFTLSNARAVFADVVPSTQSITFTDALSTLELNKNLANGAFQAAIGGFQPGDTIALDGLGADAVSYGGGTLSLFSGGRLTGALALTTAGTSTLFDLTPDGIGGTLLTLGAGAYDTTGYGTLPAGVIQAALSTAASRTGALNVVTLSNGGGLGRPLSGKTNIAVVAYPTASLATSTGYSGIIAQGTASVAIADAVGGNALLVANQGNDTLTGAGAGDTLVGGTGATQLFGGSDNTLLVGGAGTNILVGGGGATTAYVTGNGSAAYAGAGAFTVTDLSSNSVIVGGAGPMVLYGGTRGVYFLSAGSSTYVAGGPADTVSAGAGAATIFDNGSSSTYFGGPGSLFFVAGAGSSTVTGGSGAAVIIGANGSNVAFFGAASGNLISAGAGNETLNAAGATGANSFYGGTGAAIIAAGKGNDTFVAGAGGTTIAGGGGANLYIFVNASGGGTTTITDFSVAAGDRLALRGYSSPVINAALAGASHAGGTTTLTLPDSTRITLSGVANLTSAGLTP